MNTTVTAAIVAALTAASVPALAAEAEAPLPPTYIVYKLTQDGVQLRSLEAERGGYEARVQATDGSIVKVGVDPQTAELTDAYSHARVRKPDGAAPRVDAAQAIQAVAATGYWDVREVELERGAWRVKAQDDSGRMGRFSVDAETGAVK